MTAYQGHMTGLRAKLLSYFGGPVSRRLAQWSAVLEQINGWESTLEKETDRDLRKRSLSLRYRARSGEPLRTIVSEAYALVREASRRTIKQRHYDVQMIGGLALFNNCIAEMETGEGKTLTATLPLYIHSLVGKGAHLATVNDYLAERDANMMRPVFEMLGLTIGIVLTPDSQDDRRKAYACDITYGTSKEFGFDFLRDRLLLRRMGVEQNDMLNSIGLASMHHEGEQPVQRGSHFCLVDEADSILIDEARTPLIIGSLGEKAVERITVMYQWSAHHAPEFVENVDYEYEEDELKVELTATGRAKVRALPKPEILATAGLIDMYQYIERGIKVHRDFFLDRQYVVRDGEIVIVDENTGRLAEGRKWRDGIHQAIEAKEKIEVTVPTGQAARITIQDLFQRYKHLAGMTGTAFSSSGEFRKVYRMTVVPVPTNRPVQRIRLPDRVFGSANEKWRAIAEDVRDMHLLGRPVLVGTRSIEKSIIISSLLKDMGIEHKVLNANEIAAEAEIVKDAGQRGKVTVATNMAGRGTDVKLGAGIQELGGLHVICSELHDSFRVDRQLMGRCGRQGDPGTVRQYSSLDDDVLKNAFGTDYSEKMKVIGQKAGNYDGYNNALKRAQRKIEAKHLRDRMMLLHHEKERKKMQREMGQDPYLDTPD